MPSCGLATANFSLHLPVAGRQKVRQVGGEGEGGERGRLGRDGKRERESTRPLCSSQVSSKARVPPWGPHQRPHPNFITLQRPNSKHCHIRMHWGDPRLSP